LADGTQVGGGEFDAGHRRWRDIHPTGTLMLAMTYLYGGQREMSLDGGASGG